MFFLSDRLRQVFYTAVVDWFSEYIREQSVLARTVPEVTAGEGDICWGRLALIRFCGKVLSPFCIHVPVARHSSGKTMLKRTN